ncbi:MAG: radical SAM protein [Dehalococcoidales bacterium]|nr:radical SAM protein [Dehalococcoidales bacterium]
MKAWICTTLTSFFGPTQGAARLYAYQKKQGHDVSLKDFNQDGYSALLSRNNLERTFGKINFVIEPLRRNKFLREDIGAILLRSSNKNLRNLLLKGIMLGSSWSYVVNSPDIFKKPIFKILGSKIREDNILYAMVAEKEHVITEVDRAREIIDREFLNLTPNEFITHFNTLLCGKALIDAVYFPAQLDFGLGFHGIAYAPKASDIERAVNDENHNYLVPYYRNQVMPLFREENPEIVGISITHVSEFIPAFTLAYQIKSEYPHVHICLGGAALTEASHRICNNFSLWSFFDSLILGPGEYAFSQLIEHLETNTELSDVPNLIYRENGLIKKSDKLHEFDINDACTPEYVSVRPKSILPLETGSGCYWGKCIFCYYPKIGTVDFNPEYQKKRVRDIELVLEDMRKLKEEYDPVFIGITDSSLHPKRIEQIAEYNLGNGETINFSAFIRFEKDFRSPAFCQKLAQGGFLGGQIGLESGSQRVNDIINKGVNLGDAEIIIGNFYRAGILAHIYSIIGLPGETKEDSQMTHDFLKRWHHMITLGWQLYPIGITEHGPLAERAAEFGLELTPMPDEFLIQVMQYRMEKGLSQGESMALTIRFYEKLKRFMHPINKIMDVESHKLFLLAQKAKGLNINKVKQE